MSRANVDEELEGPDPGRGHPNPADLERFMRCELDGAERHAVVRHLLAGCEKCRDVTARLWHHGSRETISLIAMLTRPEAKLARRRRRARAAKWDPRMRAALDALTSVAQEILRDEVKILEGVRDRLEVLAAGLSLAPAEDPDTSDTAEEMRAVLACVLQDEIRPAIDDLRAVADHPINLDDDGPEAA